MSITIQEAAEQYIARIKDSRSKRTVLQYQSGLRHFLASLEINYEIDLDETLAGEIPPKSWDSFFSWLNQSYKESTEKVYMTALLNFLDWLVKEDLIDSDVLLKARIDAKQRTRKSGQRIPSFPEEEIKKVIDFAYRDLPTLPTEDIWERLINLRDAAFIVTLADTGLRVHEACKLTRGEINDKKQEIITIGKGDKEAVIEISSRAVKMIKNFLTARREIDGKSGRPLSSLAVFPRYSKNYRAKVLPIGTNTGRQIVNRVVELAFAEDLVKADKHQQEEIRTEMDKITPHSFRHHFVTRVLNESDGDIVLAQTLARHEDIGVTKRYIHLADSKKKRQYRRIFNEDGE
jgi:site-specific recombinase XerD